MYRPHAVTMLSHTLWPVILGKDDVATVLSSCARQGRCIKWEERATSQRKHAGHSDLNRRRSNGLVERARIEMGRADHSVGRVLREKVAL